LKKSLIISLLLIVAMPLVLLSWIAWRSVGDEQARFIEKLTSVQEERLLDRIQTADLWRARTEAELTVWLEGLAGSPQSTWRDQQQSNRFATQVFMIDGSKQWLYPKPTAPDLSQDEQQFIKAFRDYLPHPHPEDTPNKTRDSGWISWFDGPGPQWAFWTRTPGDQIIGLQLDRVALMADLLAQLPDTPQSEDSANSKLTGKSQNPDDGFFLLNAQGDVLYQWGKLSERTDTDLLLDEALPKPFAMLRLEYRSALPKWTPALDPGLTALLAGLGATGLLILMLGSYLFKESRREINLARQRVSFVNQVSHELKTPLTNIQLYGELLEDELDEHAAGREQLKIIQEESLKLSRMIQNVLTFARQQRSKLKVNPRPQIPDRLIERTIAAHMPGIEQQGIKVETDLDATDPMKLDADVVAQILGNLISNAEKYAVGSQLAFRSRRKKEILRIDVADTGPGIPKKAFNKVFQPFVRLDNSVTEGVSGTGIGLSIARDLARLHGGDLSLRKGKLGAHFVLTLKSLDSTQ